MVIKALFMHLPVHNAYLMVVVDANWRSNACVPSHRRI